LLRKIFSNPSERRLRAAWRLGLLLAMLFGIGLGLSLVLGAVAAGLGHLPGKFGLKAIALLIAYDPVYAAASFGTKCLAVMASVWLAVRFLDKRPFADLGLRLSRAWFKDLVFGFILGGLLMGAVFAVEVAAGWARVEGCLHTSWGQGAFWPALICMLVAFVCVGVYEEVLSRGWGIRNLAEGLNLPGLGARGAVLVAWLVTSLVFGLGHAMNPNASMISCLGVAGAGILLGLPYVLTGELAIPAGLHIGWNFFQGNVFGFAVSGRDFGVSLLQIRQTGPVWMTGGAFGPEAGALGVAACALGCVMVLGWLRLVRKQHGLRSGLARYEGRRVREEEKDRP